MEGMCEYGVVRKTNPAPFLVKTYMLVDDPATDSVVSWNEGGTAFVVWQPAEFARDLLPTLFKHCNFSSFVRQLNTYGFRKVASRRWEFSNDMFQRGKRELLIQIQRRKAWTHRQQPHPTVSATPPTQDEEQQRSSSATSSSSSDLNNLVDENKRLKQENVVLSSKLTTMKQRCQELLNLVKICTNQKEDDQDKQRQPMLFGVRLQVEEEREKKRQKSAQLYNTATLLFSQSCK